MTLNEMICCRQSCRSFTGVPVSAELLDAIRAFSMKPLYPEIKVHWEVVSKDMVRSLCPWTTPQLIAIYSEETDGWLENVGFMFQQMDLYLQSIGLGACWLGLGKMRPNAAPRVAGMQFAILLAFGNPKEGWKHRQLKDFKRKSLEQIADLADSRLEPARLAPSAVNSQPWYFTHGDEAIHVYRVDSSRLRYMNRIDMGIALAHLYVANEETFRFFREENAAAVDGCEYVGSITL